MSVFESKTSRLVTSIVTLAAIAVAAGCGEETELSVGAQATVVDVVPVIPPMANYSGPGSNWNYDVFDDGTYQVTHSTLAGMDADLSVSGTYQATAEGFLSLTIDASSGDDAPVRGGTAWALEIPNYALVLSPVSTADDHFVAMVDGSECPNTDLASNWINVRASLSSDSQSPESSYFGSLDYSFADGSTVLTSRFALTTGNPAQGEYSLGNGFCRDGIINTATSDIYLAPTGGTTAHVNAAAADGGMFVFALPRTTILSISDLDGSYAGVFSDDAAGPDEKVSPVLVTCNSGICSGDFVTDIDAGTLAGQPFTVDLSGTINEPGLGLTTGEFSLGESTSNIGCMVDPDALGTGQRTISCAGQSPTRSYGLLNLILTSND